MKKFFKLATINAIILTFILELSCAVWWLLSSRRSITTPDYIAAIESGGGSGKASLRFDSYGSPFWASGTRSYFNQRQFDHDGFLLSDAEWLKNRSSEDLAIGVFGDSYTIALQVPEDETFVSRLTDELALHGKRGRFLNFAVGATGTVQQLSRARAISDNVQLDGLLVFFLPQNDVLNNSSHPNNATLASSYKSVCANLQWSALRATLRNSFFGRRVCLAIEATSSSLAGPPFEEPSATAKRHSVQLGETILNLDDRAHWLDVYHSPSNGLWVEAWQRTFDSLIGFKQLADDHSIPLVVVIVADSLQIFHEFNPPADASAYDFTYPNQKIMNFCKDNGLNCLDSLPFALKFIRDHDLDRPYLSHVNDGHYSKLGHDMMTQFLATKKIVEVYSRAFSGEVDTGSPSETRPNKEKESEARFY